MTQRKELVFVKENNFNRVTNYLKNIFFSDKIRKNDIYKNINILENKLEELKKQNKSDEMIQVCIKTTENRIAVLNHRAGLKISKKKRKNILVQ